MPAKKLDLKVRQGIHFERILATKLRQATDLFTYVNWTGYTFSGHLRQVRSQAAPDATLSFAVVDRPLRIGEDPLTVRTNEGVMISLPKETTAALAPGAYYYDIIATPPGGNPVDLLAGTFTIQEAATH